MSHAWQLRCATCEGRPGTDYINHGEEQWQAVVAIWPHVKAIRETLSRWCYLDYEIRVIGYHGDSIWDFLDVHASHGVEMASEYGIGGDHPPVLLLPRVK